MEDIESRVKKIVAKNLDIDDESRITLDSHFVDDLGADSLDQVELVMALEEEFGIEQVYHLCPSESATGVNNEFDFQIRDEI